MKGRAKIFVVDDHPVVCAGLTALIRQEADLVACGQASSVPQALRGIGASQPDLVIVGLSFSNSSGLELIKELQIRHPSIRVLVLSMYNEMDQVERALRAGACGYIDKRETAKSIINGARRALRGRRYITAELAEKLLERRIRNSNGGDDRQQFSDREQEVFELLARGCETGQIAAALHLSIKTVHTYCDRMRHKMGVHTERELLVEAVRWNERRSDHGSPLKTGTH